MTQRRLLVVATWAAFVASVCAVATTLLASSLEIKVTISAASASPSAVVAKIDRAVVATQTCEVELGRSAARSERLYQRTPSWRFRRWSLRLWTERAAECRADRSALLARWWPTLHCETGGTDNWLAVSPGGTYLGGLQFDQGTWEAHGGLRFAPRADLASPAEQATVASRLTYDGWPNCPNP